MPKSKHQIPGGVSFDVPYQDYSWMAYLARAGFDVFAMDFTGYGQSTRPSVMNDPCNLAPEQQPALIPHLLSDQCVPSFPFQLTTLPSDWNDLSAVVDYVRSLRGVDQVNLIGWSLGGRRAGGYAAQFPKKVQKLVLLAPGYDRMAPADPPSKVPADGVPMTTGSYAGFTANWDSEVGCPGQYDPDARNMVWAEMLKSDPVGATWGSGVRRAPQTTRWGWNSEMAAKVQAPALIVTGAHDKTVLPARVRELYADLGSAQKVFVDLACSSHAAMWEKNHTLLFRASLEWLTQGRVNGKKEGMLRLGYYRTLNRKLHALPERVGWTVNDDISRPRSPQRY